MVAGDLSGAAVGHAGCVAWRSTAHDGGSAVHRQPAACLKPDTHVPIGHDIKGSMLGWRSGENRPRPVRGRRLRKRPSGGAPWRASISCSQLPGKPIREHGGLDVRADRRLLGFVLPDQARLHQEWWTNATKNPAAPSYSDSSILARRTATPNWSPSRWCLNARPDAPPAVSPAIEVDGACRAKPCQTTEFFADPLYPLAIAIDVDDATRYFLGVSQFATHGRQK